MNGPSAPDDTKRRVDAKIDTLMDKLDSLSAQVDTVAEKLAKADAEAIRRAFQERQKGHDGG